MSKTTFKTRDFYVADLLFEPFLVVQLTVFARKAKVARELAAKWALEHEEKYGKLISVDLYQKGRHRRLALWLCQIGFFTPLSFGKGRKDG